MKIVNFFNENQCTADKYTIICKICKFPTNTFSQIFGFEQPFFYDFELKTYVY